MKKIVYITSLILSFLIIINSAHAIVGTSENYTITIENIRGINFDVEEGRNNFIKEVFDVRYLVIGLALLAFILLIFRIKKLGKRV